MIGLQGFTAVGNGTVNITSKNVDSTLVKGTNGYGSICNMAVIERERKSAGCKSLQLKKRDIFGGKDSVIQWGFKLSQIRQQR